MAFSGIGKLIKDLVTGTPADADYFAFGNTDLKKISFPNLKKALGIDALNSALTTYEKITIDKWNVRRFGNMKAFSYNNRAGSKWTGGNKFALNATNLIPEKYRPQEDFGVIVTATAGGKKCTIDILKTGTIYIRPSEDILDTEWITIFIPYI